MLPVAVEGRRGCIIMSLPKLHYFDQEEADENDMLLGMCIAQGYVPETCLLGGATVWHEVKAGRDPCAGCVGPKQKCKGRLEKRQVGI